MTNCPDGEMMDYPQIVEQALGDLGKVISKAFSGDRDCQMLISESVDDSYDCAKAFYNLIDSCLPAFLKSEINDAQKDILLKNAIDFIYAYRQGLIDSHDKWEHLV